MSTLVNASTPAGAISATYGTGSGFCASVVSGGHDLGASFDNVYACGPLPAQQQGFDDPPFEDSLYGFQCVELANRFLWDVWGINPVRAPTGAQFATYVHNANPSVALIPNGTVGQPYLPGDIVSFTGGLDGDGHVAVVMTSTEDGNGNGTATLLEENAASNGQTTVTISGWSMHASGVTPYDFLPLSGLNTGPTNGGYVQNPAGTIFRVAGGYLFGLTAVECQELGCANVDLMNASQFAAYQSAHTLVANGAFLRSYETGWIGEAVGGGVYGLTSTECTQLNCGPAAVTLPQRAIDYYVATNPTISNGTFVRNVDTGWIGEAVGGALFGLTADECNELNCGPQSINVPSRIIGWYQSTYPTISNGTFVRNVDTGWIGEAVGTVLFGLTANECNELNCGPPSINVPSRIIAWYQSTYPTISNGTFVRNVDTGWIGEAVGTALVGLTSDECNELNCGPPSVNVPTRIIDDYVAAFPAVADGTVVEGIPSTNYWTFEFGGLLSTGTTSSAVIVADDSLGSFPRDTAPTITSGNATIFFVGSTGVFTVAASAVPISTFSETGPLPNGVTLSPSGSLAGTPPAGAAGTYPITITASNGIAPDAAQSFTLTVLPMGITTLSLPSGAVKSPYRATLAASGGNPPYKWSMASGSGPLPPGLKLTPTGVISGKPKKAGTYSFTVEVVDTKTKIKPHTHNSTTQALSLTIS